ncbi:MAG: hypothetical protein ACRC4U_03410, partial [Shewanella sp.]
ASWHTVEGGSSLVEPLSPQSIELHSGLARLPLFIFQWLTLRIVVRQLKIPCLQGGFELTP